MDHSRETWVVDGRELRFIADMEFHCCTSIWMSRPASSVRNMTCIHKTKQHTPHNIHHTPYTIHHTPYTVHHTPHTTHPTTCTIHPTTCTPQHVPYTTHHTPHTIHHMNRISPRPIERTLGALVCLPSSQRPSLPKTESHQVQATSGQTRLL